MPEETKPNDSGSEETFADAMGIPGIQLSVGNADDSEEGQPDSEELSEEGTPNDEEGEAETEEEGSSEEGTPEISEEEKQRRTIDAQVSKAVAKNDEGLKAMLSLLKDSPEKIAELKESNPEVYERLEKRFPDDIKQPTIETNTVNEIGLADVVKNLLDNQEKTDMKVWAKENKVSDADLLAREDNLKQTAKILVREGLAKDFPSALLKAGPMVFPSTYSSGVDEEGIKKLEVQGAGGSNRVPSPGTSLSDIDKASIVMTGVTEEEYERYQNGPIPLPHEL